MVDSTQFKGSVTPKLQFDDPKTSVPKAKEAKEGSISKSAPK